MEHERDLAVGAHPHPAAGPAGEEVRPAAAVEQQDPLAARVAQVGERHPGLRVQRVVLPAHVEDLDRRQRAAVDPTGQPQPLELVDRLRARRGAAGDQHRAVHLRPAGGDRPGVVARVALVLVGALVLLVDDDQPDVLQRGEDRRARPDAHPRLAAGQPAPLVVALAVGEPGVQHGGHLAEPRGEARQRLRRQRDLRHEHDRRATRRQRPLHRLEVHLGLAGAGDAVQQEAGTGAAVGRRRRGSARAPPPDRRSAPARAAGGGADVVARGTAPLRTGGDRHQPARLEPAQGRGAELGARAPGRRPAPPGSDRCGCAQPGRRVGQRRLARRRSARRRGRAWPACPRVAPGGSSSASARARVEQYSAAIQSASATQIRRQPQIEHGVGLDEPLGRDLGVLASSSTTPGSRRPPNGTSSRRPDLHLVRVGQPVVERPADRAGADQRLHAGDRRRHRSPRVGSPVDAAAVRRARYAAPVLPRPAASRSACALSVRSQVKSWSSRPKWP